MSRSARLWFQWMLFVLFAAGSYTGHSQSDSIRILVLDRYLDQVRQHHPVARQAALLQQEADAVMLSARGGFDPKLQSDWGQKSFEGKNYFFTGESGFKIPTWYGIELKGQFNVANGQFLNAEGTLPSAGQAVAGISVPLLQGLAIDERRTALFQARVFKDANANERRQILNDLLLDATKAYWEWAFTYQQQRILAQAVDVARFRLQAIRDSYQQGYKPAVDTLEALTQVQIREVEWLEAGITYQQARLQASNFMWLDGEVPLEITDNLTPALLTEQPFSGWNEEQILAWMQQLEGRHPDILAYQFKNSQLELDRRLKREKLKPQLNAEYNFLANGFDFTYGQNGVNSFPNNLLFQNYKWGLSFSMPLLLRKERGQLELANLKIRDNQLKQDQKIVEVSNKLKAYTAELQLLEQQIAQYTAVVNNYQSLLDAENDKLLYGKSSLFLVNARENKLIEGRQKLAKLQAQFLKIRQSVRWAAGTLADEN